MAPSRIISPDRKTIKIIKGDIPNDRIHSPPRIFSEPSETIKLQPPKKHITENKRINDPALRLKERLRLFEKEIQDIESVNRGINRIFERDQRIRPNFSSTWVIPSPPRTFEGKELNSYMIKQAKVSLYYMNKKTEGLYHIIPEEYSLSDKELKLLEYLKLELMEHYPINIQITNIRQAKDYVRSYSQQMIELIARKNNISLNDNKGKERVRFDRLVDVIVQYTAGLGILEHLLNDPIIQDIYIDSPSGMSPIYVSIAGKGTEGLPPICSTNIIMPDDDIQGILSRFKFISGRPFSEAHPLLECDVHEYDTRISAIGPPLSPDGIAFAMRKHSAEPWTLPRLIAAGSITPLAAGLISFLLDGKSTMIIAGSRGSGKSSLLSAIMLEFPQSQRILTIEDTLELPVNYMKKIGYKVQSMKISSSMADIADRSSTDALRVSLRLGESALVLGEVRGEETRTLYEAMSAGTAGSSVLGTFHADSARSVYKRVVSDMGINPQSFAATDIVIIAGMVRPGGSMTFKRKVIEISEYVKDDPGRFNDIMKLQPESENILPTEMLERNSLQIGKIARDWNVTYAKAVDNIHLRANVKEYIVKSAIKNHDNSILMAPMNFKANNIFKEILEKESAKRTNNYDDVFQKWKREFDKYLK